MSAKGNISELVGAQDGTVLVPVYDWAAFLPVRKFNGIKKHHQFIMSADARGN